MIVKGQVDMSSVSTAFKVHYNQKLGDPSGHLGGTHHGLRGNRRPCLYIVKRVKILSRRRRAYTTDHVIFGDFVWWV